jgi:hypothetical protein
VKFGCPIVWKFCSDSLCVNGAICKSASCWEGTKSHAGYFECQAITNYDRTLHDGKWQCYQLFDVGPLGLQPVTEKCLDYQYCKADIFKGCLPNPEKTGTKNSNVFGTSHDCTIPPPPGN